MIYRDLVGQTRAWFGLGLLRDVYLKRERHVLGCVPRRRVAAPRRVDCVLLFRKVARGEPFLIRREPASPCVGLEFWRNHTRVGRLSGTGLLSHLPNPHVR
jgi:hypothetical protein